MKTALLKLKPVIREPFHGPENQREVQVPIKRQEFTASWHGSQQVFFKGFFWLWPEIPDFYAFKLVSVFKINKKTFKGPSNRNSYKTRLKIGFSFPNRMHMK